MYTFGSDLESLQCGQWAHPGAFKMPPSSPAPNQSYPVMQTVLVFGHVMENKCNLSSLILIGDVN